MGSPFSLQMISELIDAVCVICPSSFVLLFALDRPLGVGTAVEPARGVTGLLFGLLRGLK
jgi:hypothetical protein